MAVVTLKALTVWQPWATLIATQAKRNETRRWTTAHRGWLAIHAGARKPDTAQLQREPFSTALRGALARGPLPCGVVVAVVRLAEVLPITPELVATLTPNEVAFGDYGPNRWAWRLTEVHALEHPFPARGALGLWTWEPPREVVEMVGIAG
jgi:hypothetical protein